MKYLKTYENKNRITFKEWIVGNPKDLNVDYLDCSNSNLIDLDGIQEFKNLEFLFCYDNHIKILPDLSNLKKLRYIDCSDNQLIELPDLSNLKHLEEIYCYDNDITELPDLIGIKKLRFLFCNGNRLPFECSDTINNLKEYLKWHKKEYPWMWDAKNYNL